MKVLVVGGGSMGRRRLRDLTYLNPGNVFLFEPQPQRCHEVAERFATRGFTDFADALALEPDAMVISSPPTLHASYAQTAMDRGLHVFAEVPFIHDKGILLETAARADGYPGVLGISHTMCYYPPIRIIYDIVHGGSLGRPLYAEFSLGNYLPDWHPYEDYRDFYGGHEKLGGSGLDMLFHDLNPIHWWLGPVCSVLARFSKLSNLEIQGSDTQDVLLWFAEGPRGFMHNDVIERGTLGRHVRISAEEGTLEWHQHQPFVRVFEAKGNRHIEIPFSSSADYAEARQASMEMSRILERRRAPSGRTPPSGEPAFTYESCYLREMRSFLDAAAGKAPYPASIAGELRTVSVVDAIQRSAAEQREVKV